MRNASDKIFRVQQNIHFMFNNFFSKSRAIYEIKWKNTVQSDGNIAHAPCVPHN